MGTGYPVKIIYLNNYYYIRGGSERVFFGEMDIMKRYGHAVAGFSRKHPLDLPAQYDRFFPPNIVTERINLSWATVRTMKEIFYSRSARKGLEQLISSFKPDIAHIHNMYGRLTTSVLDLLAQKKIPIVMTLHDYKLACPSYLFMRNSRVCEDCKGGRFFMAVRNRCHKRSYAASTIVALESYMNEWLKKYRKNVHFFISPSLFLKDKLTEYGWPARQIKHVPNFLNITDFEPSYVSGSYFLYLGRLSEEKGIDNLIQAYIGLKQNRVGLTIVGEGPIRPDLERLAHGNPAIRFTGYLSGKMLQDITKNALSVIVPSVCYENAPISILEAMAYGKPTIGARIGGIPEMIKDGVNGFLFEAGHYDALKNVLERFTNIPTVGIEQMGKAARRKVESENSTESHYRNLMEIYQEVLMRTEG